MFRYFCQLIWKKGRPTLHYDAFDVTRFICSLLWCKNVRLKSTKQKKDTLILRMEGMLLKETKRQKKEDEQNKLKAGQKGERWLHGQIMLSLQPVLTRNLSWINGMYACRSLPWEHSLIASFALKLPGSFRKGAHAKIKGSLIKRECYFRVSRLDCEREKATDDMDRLIVSWYSQRGRLLLTAQKLHFFDLMTNLHTLSWIHLYEVLVSGNVVVCFAGSRLTHFGELTASLSCGAF